MDALPLTIISALAQKRLIRNSYPFPLVVLSISLKPDEDFTLLIALLKDIRSYIVASQSAESIT